MTGNQMLDMLGIRMNDPGELAITSLLKLEALDRATLRLVELLDEELLGSLETEQLNVAAAAGKCPFSTIETDSSETILRKGRDSGIRRVRIKTGAYYTMIDPDQVKEYVDNAYMTATVASPYCYVQVANIYILPTSTTAVDVWFLKKPAAHAASASAYTDIDDSLHELIVDLAQAFLMNDPKIEQRAVAEINALNKGAA